MTFTHPFPWCLLQSTHRARAYIPACQTDIRRTIAEHDPRRLDGWKTIPQPRKQDPQP